MPRRWPSNKRAGDERSTIATGRMTLELFLHKVRWRWSYFLIKRVM